MKFQECLCIHRIQLLLILFPQTGFQFSDLMIYLSRRNWDLKEFIEVPIHLRREIDALTVFLVAVLEIRLYERIDVAELTADAVHQFRILALVVENLLHGQATDLAVDFDVVVVERH